MKRIVIGDIHGLFGVFQDIYNLEKPDSVIIVGDYFDSFTIDPIVQKYGWEDLMCLRDNHKGGEFIMITGNHDMHYLSNFYEKYSGYNNYTATFASDFVKDALYKNILQMCYIDEINKTIYSHAGVTQTWFNKWCKKLKDINKLPIDAFRFVGTNIYGDDPRNSPIWVRPNSLISDPYYDKDHYMWNQIFGHTHKSKVTIVAQPGPKTTLYNIDCMPNEYLVETLDDNKKLITREVKTYE